MNISSEEFDELIDTIHKEFIEYNSYTGCTRVYAQKIMDNEQKNFIINTHVYLLIPVTIYLVTLLFQYY